MNTATIAVLGRAPGAVHSSREPFIVTNNGKVQNLIVNVSGIYINEVVDSTRSMQACASLSFVRFCAQAGVRQSAVEDIDADVAAVRAAR